MRSEEREPRPYVSPATPVVIGNAGAAANGPFQPYGYDGPGFDTYNSQPT
jgi:hypothetical protein